MASSGPNSGGTFENDATVGTVDWANPDRAVASDDSRSTAYIGAAASTTKYLKATNFGFDIPVGATINGILVEIEKSTYDAYVSSDYSVKIVKGGTIQGDEMALGGNWPIAGAEAYYSHGGATILCGLSWEYSDINSSGFGVVVSASLASWATARIDHIRITVYYTEGAVANTFWFGHA